ncbi:MAG: hypothetical protein HYV27_16855 [Candidatus Hydrogenedentes bacterium]|nr:hypothetical protein [Candidatus Hydrogenedentota bacterium]
MLLFTGVAAAAILFLKYQLEGIRVLLIQQAQKRAGIQLDAGSVKVNGLNGLLIDDLTVALNSKSGPAVVVQVPRAILDIDLVDLVYGQPVLERLRIDNARIVLDRPLEHEWFAADLGESPALGDPFPFRALGKNCTLEVHNLLGEAGITVSSLDVDITRLTESPDLYVRLTGLLNGRTENTLDINPRYAHLDDFDLRVQGEALRVEDLSQLVPDLKQVLASGQAAPNVRVAGYPGSMLVVNVEMPFQGLEFQQEIPLQMARNGQLSVLAHYDTVRHELNLTTAQVKTDRMRGRLDGTVSLAETSPNLNLRLELTEMPVNDLLRYIWQEDLSAFGDLTLVVEDPYSLQVTFVGPLSTPQIAVNAGVNAGKIVFDPKSTQLPAGELEFGAMKFGWNSETGEPSGSLALHGGSLTHQESGITIGNISGTLNLAPDAIFIDPLNATILGNPAVGSIRYLTQENRTEFAVSGSFANIEQTQFAKHGTDLTLAGALTAIQCKGSLTAKAVSLDLSADATQLYAAHEWWLEKPIGTGATLEGVHIDIVPRKSVHVKGAAIIDGLRLNTEAEIRHAGKTWQLEKVLIDSGSLSLLSMAKCLRIPYGAQSGQGTEGYFKWLRFPGEDKHVEVQIGGKVETAAVTARDVPVPLVFEGAQVDVTFGIQNGYRTGTLNLHAQNAALPPFGSRWLLPMVPDDPAVRALYPKIERDWTYTLTAGKLSYPPWNGTNFHGEGFSNKAESGLSSFDAVIAEGGTVSGSYRVLEAENIGTLKAAWKATPSEFILNHLTLPRLLSGLMDGSVDYSVDYDDPQTLRGAGSFTIVNGQFSADYLFKQFEEQIEGKVFSLPPSLKFSQLKADLELAGDVIHTKNIVLDSPVLKLTGDGKFVMGGDMDHNIRLSISPEIAARIPLIRASFNVEGFRNSQTDIELAFHLTGPSFNPKLEVVGLPGVGEIISSGVVEVGSEVIRVIDLPRQILLDLFKIGGGIAGAAN